MTVETAAHPLPAAGRSHRPVVPALIAGALGFAAVAAIHAVASWAVSQPESDVVFPTEVATYSWFTSHGDLGMPAAMIYQNGIGVEFMDAPQAVALGVDGTTYRRVGAAEQRSAPTDQGDPAVMVLSADGTFAVIAGANGHGSVEVRSFVDGTTRQVPVGDGRSVVPLSISSDGDQVLVVLADGELSRYTDPAMNGTLALLELSTGNLLEYPLDGVTSAALSPDGSRIAAQTASGAMVMDAEGRGIRDLPAALEGQHFGADAWSPDGTRLVTLVHEEVWVEEPEGRRLTSAVSLQITDAGGGSTSLIPVASVEDAVPLGWRDDGAVVLQTYAGDNTSEFLWVDAATGVIETFATYASGFTGAAIGSADIARDLVGEWSVEARPVDQGWPATVLLGIVVGGAAALVTWIIASRGRGRVRTP